MKNLEDAYNNKIIQICKQCANTPDFRYESGDNRGVTIAMRNIIPQLSIQTKKRIYDKSYNYDVFYDIFCKSKPFDNSFDERVNSFLDGYEVLIGK